MEQSAWSALEMQTNQTTSTIMDLSLYLTGQGLLIKIKLF